MSLILNQWFKHVQHWICKKWFTTATHTHTYITKVKSQSGLFSGFIRLLVSPRLIWIECFAWRLQQGWFLLDYGNPVCSGMSSLTTQMEACKHSRFGLLCWWQWCDRWQAGSRCDSVFSVLLFAAGLSVRRLHSAVSWVSNFQKSVDICEHRVDPVKSTAACCSCVVFSWVSRKMWKRLLLSSGIHKEQCVWQYFTKQFSVEVIVISRLDKFQRDKTVAKLKLYQD